MDKSKLSVGVRAAMDEHVCQLYLRVDGDLPRGLWAWNVYVDGNVHRRGPGSTRRDPQAWYASLEPGEHRVVLRGPDSRSDG